MKASAASIIDAVFDVERGLTNSRIAVVGYNDPFTETILSFTNQEDIEARKSAALLAINSISVSGGGDFPELTYGGLLRALDGRAGEWRPEAVSRKIVLFGDASPKDAELRPQVFALAKDLGVEVAGLFTSTLALPEPLAATGAELSVTTLSVMPAAIVALAVDDETPPTRPAAPVSVQIFTIVLGGNSEAVADFELIASETGGAAFSAAGSSEIVDAILEVLALPNYAITFATPTIVEGSGENTAVTVTISRDVADTAAEVFLVVGGTADDADYTGPVPASISFAAGEFTQSFTLTIVGDTAFEETETVTISITSVSEPASIVSRTAQLSILNDDAENSAPVAANDAAQATGTDPLSIDVLANDSDADDDELSVVALVGTPASGTVVVNEDNTLTYTSTTGETSIDVFRYTVTDGTATASAQVVVRVVGAFASEQTGDDGDNIITGTAGSDQLDGGLGSDFLAGLAGADILLGGDGVDYLLGGAGDDVIIGGAGNDVLYGGLGTNVFVFYDGDLGATATETDQITSFGVLGTDFLDFSAIDAIEGGEDDAFTFIGNAAFSGTAGELRFEQSGIYTDVFGDTDGDGMADIALRLYGAVPLDGSALIL